MKYNLHTHSVYCGHATGTINEYAEYAEKCNFDLLGFSDHIPFPDNHFKSSRMDYSKRKDYQEDVRREKDRGMKVLLGYECDYSTEWKGYFEDILGEVDYLIAGTHYMRRDVGNIVTPFYAPFSQKDFVLYTDATIKAMESGLFAFIAHPDVYLCTLPFDKNAYLAAVDLITAAIELDIPLEINSNGMAKADSGAVNQGCGYPNKEFWTLAKEMGAKAVISSDAHKVENLEKYYERIVDFADEIKIELLEPVLSKDGKLSFRTQEDK